MYEGVICFLQGTADLYAAGAVGEGFDHAGQFRLRLEQRAEIAHVVHQRTQVHLENRLMGLAQDPFRDDLFVVS